MKGKVLDDFMVGQGGLGTWMSWRCFDTFEGAEILEIVNSDLMDQP